MEDDRLSIKEHLITWVAALVGIALVAPILLGLGILAWQVLAYLMLGTWHPISVVAALAHFEFGWAANPAEWLGLHSILETIPVSAALIVGGLLFYSFVNSLIDAR